MRFKVGVSYIGTAYSGFVRTMDSRLPSIQGRIEEALDAFLLSPDKEERRGYFKSFQVSSRTDAGVHALRNTFHVDIERKDGGSYSSKGLVEGLNFYLSKQSAKRPISTGLTYEDSYDQNTAIDVGDEMIRQNYRNHTTLRSVIITDAQKMNSGSFDARLDATGRTYDYYIISPNEMYHSKVLKTVREGEGGADKGYREDVAYGFDSLLNNRFMFHQHRAWQIAHPVDIQEMRKAASLLVGEHDFSTFRNSGCQSSSPVRVIKDITVTSMPLLPEYAPAWSSLSLPPRAFGVPDAHLIVISVTADSFLLRMVRNLVAALVHVSRKGGQERAGHRHAHDIKTMLGWKKRSMMLLKPAPAEGLYLRTVHYDDDHENEDTEKAMQTP